MKHPWLWFVLSMIAALSAQAADKPVAHKKDPASVVRALFDAFNRHDASGMAQLYAPDALLESSDFCTSRHGPVAVRQTYQALFEEVPDIADTMDEMIVQGDRVAVRFHARGTINGEVFELPIATFIQVVDGQIASDRTLFHPPSSTCSP